MINISKIKEYFKPVKKLRIGAGLIIIIQTLISALLIYQMQGIIDLVINKKYNLLNNSLLNISIVVSIYMIVSFLSQFLARKLEFTSSYSIVEGMYGEALQQDLKYYNKNASGEISSRIQNDSQNIAAWFGAGKLYAFWQFITFIITISMLLYYNVVITLTILFITLICFIINSFISKTISSETEKIQQKTADINQEMLQSIQGIREIRQLRKEDFFKKRMHEKLFNEKLPIGIKLSILYSIYISLAILMSYVLPILSIAMGAMYAIRGEITIGSILAIYALVGQLQEPIRILSDSINTRKISLAMIERNKELFDINNIKEISKISNKGMESFKNLSININSFSYNKDHIILEDLEINIEPHSINCIIGSSGSGKTTLANLILRFENLEEENGSILWNDECIKHFKLEEYYKNVLMANQTPYIFKGTIRENLCLGENFSDKDLLESLETTCLTDFIEEKGLDNVILEGGSNISGGQKQRLAIARTLLRKPQLIILDEPTSSLNIDLGDKLAENLTRYIKDYKSSLIVISHKDDFLKKATQVINLK